MGSTPRKAPKMAAVKLLERTPPRRGRPEEGTPAEARAVPTDPLRPVDRPAMTMGKNVAIDGCSPVF
jgi:hypothetical protein